MVKLPRPFLLLSFGAAMGLFNCAARRPPLQAPPIIEQVAADAASDRAGAIAALEAELKGKVDTANEPWLLLWAGEQRRLAGDTARAATTDEVKGLRREARDLKECVADLTLENRLLKKA